jgi:pimeloyl-ACP methyl ester carboxylesterase
MELLAEEGQISVAGMALEYQLIGAPPSRSSTIVMLHEGLGSVSTWGEFPRRVFERTRASVFAYSRAGYGASPPVEPGLPIDYIKRHALDVLPKILEAIGFSQGLLLGHSDGASMATAYAGNVADPRVRGLILMAPHFCVEPETLAEIKNARRAFETGNLRQRLARYHNYVDTAFRGWNDVWLDPRFSAFNLRAELARISVPMLIIRGDGDHYGTHLQVHMAKEICKGPLETLLMPDCGHVPHREKPAQTVDAIARFYERILPDRISQSQPKT